MGRVRAPLRPPDGDVAEGNKSTVAALQCRETARCQVANCAILMALVGAVVDPATYVAARHNHRIVMVGPVVVLEERHDRDH